MLFLRNLCYAAVEGFQKKKKRQTHSVTSRTSCQNVTDTHAVTISEEPHTTAVHKQRNPHLRNLSNCRLTPHTRLRVPVPSLHVVCITCTAFKRNSRPLLLAWQSPHPERAQRKTQCLQDSLTPPPRKSQPSAREVQICQFIAATPKKIPEPPWAKASLLLLLLKQMLSELTTVHNLTRCVSRTSRPWRSARRPLQQPCGYRRRCGRAVDATQLSKPCCRRRGP